jgi:hypothetical protein
MEITRVVETGPAALLFALTFLFGGRVGWLRRIVRDERAVVSFGAGMSAAYVFVHLMPELHGVRVAFAETASIVLRYEGMAIYVVALVGFLAFYALDHFRLRLQDGSREEEVGGAFKLHIGGFGAYAWVMAYLLVNNMEEATVSMGAYALAIAFHFLSVTHHLREEHRSAYDHLGRYVLAGAVVLGWGVGFLLPLPRGGVALLTAFISGGIIMNSTIMELPSEKDGRFFPFLSGGLLYGLILLPLG